MQKTLFCFFLICLLSSTAFAELTLTFGGDMNLNPSRGTIHATGATKHGTFYTWEEMFVGLAPLIDGDLNFANIETVISDNNLPDTGGKFTFSTHPEGFAYAVELGFNLFSLSNNHIGDYGQIGMADTLYWLDQTQKMVGDIYHSGLSPNRKAALKPTLISVQTNEGAFQIAFLAMTAVANKSSQVTDQNAGTLYFRDENDFSDAMKALRETPADYKIFSVHGGKEGKVTLDDGQRAKYRRVLSEGDVDLILGHHPHRVRPIEQVGHRLIFYSLGNFQMLGAANIGSSSSLLDYGLLGKLHLNWDPAQKRLVAQGAEIIVLTDMHAVAQAMDAENGTERIQLLNELSQQELGADALLFNPNPKGHGVTCLGGLPGPKAEKICATRLN